MSILESEKLSLRKLVVQSNQDHLEVEITHVTIRELVGWEHYRVHSLSVCNIRWYVDKHETYWNVHIEQALLT